MENHDAIINNSALQAYPNIKFNFNMKFNSIQATTEMKIAIKRVLNPNTNIKFKFKMKFKSMQAATDMKNSVKTTLTQQRRA